MSTAATLEHRELGGSGLLLPVVGLGCNNFGSRIDRERTQEVVETALDEGLIFLDTADIYGAGRSESFIGEILRGRRDRALIGTKWGHPLEGNPADAPHGSSRYIRVALENSLRRLQTDYIDLYQMHLPDAATPVEETLEVLGELVREGKVRHIGSSNFAAWQVADADWIARTRGFPRFVSAQNHYSLVLRGEVEPELTPACERFNVGIIPYLPLAGGLLTGKYRRNQPAPEGTRLSRSQNPQRFLNDRNFDILEDLERFAATNGITLLDVAIGGLAAMPQVVSVISGATSAEQVRANARAGRWVPSEAQLEEIRRITAPPSDD